MASAKSLVILYLCFSIMLYIGGFQLVTIGNQNMIEHFVDLDEEGRPIQIDDNMSSNMPQVAEGILDGALMAIVDVTLMIVGFFAFLVNITFAPIAIFISIPNMPVVVTLMIGVPLAAMYILGLVWFIKNQGGGD